MTTTTFPKKSRALYGANRTLEKLDPRLLSGAQTIQVPLFEIRAANETVGTSPPTENLHAASLKNHQIQRYMK
jgi:hypothetical protein